MSPTLEALPLSPERPKAMLSKGTRAIDPPSAQSVPHLLQAVIPKSSYNAPVTASDRSLLACSLLLLVLVLFYPAFFLGRVLAPQAALWGVPPWSELGGPNPSLGQPTNRLALSLAPRLALVQREGTRVALWNPFIGGGRVGWLAMAADNYAPLSVLAAFLARDVHHWQASALLVVVLAASGMFRLARRYLASWPAVVSAFVYALSGPVMSSLLDVPATVAAVVPWLLSFSFELPRWSAVVGTSFCAAFLWMSGGYGWPWLVVPLLGVLLRRSHPPATVASAFVATLVGLGLAFPSVFLAFFGGEVPGFWWLAGRPQAAATLSDLVVAKTLPLGAERPWVFLGWPAVVLALWGAAQRASARALALGLTFVGAVAAFAPSALLPAFVEAFRPTLALALGVALLAGLGSQRLVSHAPENWQPAVSGFLALLVLVRLLPAASLWLPWHGRDRAQLKWAAPDVEAFPQDLVLPLVTLFPPDSLVLAGLADVRAQRFWGEPKLHRLLAPGADGSLPFSRLSDALLAKLGVRWLLEPRELALVSGELFSRLSLAESQAQDSRFPVVVPSGATRLGIKASSQPSLVRLLQGDHHWVLSPDRALAGEAEGWWWWLVPEGVQAGEAQLAVTFSPSRWQRELRLAWDCSGWELAQEAGSLRWWRQRWALPLAFWHQPREAAGLPQVVAVTPQKLVIRTETPVPARLGVRLKFRPHIQKAFLDGQPVPVHQGPFPWSAVEVPAGSHRLTVALSLPLAVWLGPLVFLAFLGLLRKVRL